MKSEYLGDSYDVVKRFFIHELQKLGYLVQMDEEFIATLDLQEKKAFRKMIGLGNKSSADKRLPNALFVDPDTGIREKKGKSHATFKNLEAAAAKNDLVFAFDQSFPRLKTEEKKSSVQDKMQRFENCHAMYYSSHACFVFVCRHKQPLRQLRSHLISIGMPESRLLLGA